MKVLYQKVLESCKGVCEVAFYLAPLLLILAAFADFLGFLYGNEIRCFIVFSPRESMRFRYHLVSGLGGFCYGFRRRCESHQ